MYLPEYFRVRDHATVLAFMQNNPFAILVSCTETGPFATHVPLVIQQRENQLTLRGHVAKANLHWKHLENNPHNTLVIFHGPHAYISPANYNTREAVPTWNYGTVHV
jgi:transcriptional regulator